MAIDLKATFNNVAIFHGWTLDEQVKNLLVSISNCLNSADMENVLAESIAHSENGICMFHVGLTEAMAGDKSGFDIMKDMSVSADSTSDERIDAQAYLAGYRALIELEK